MTYSFPFNSSRIISLGVEFRVDSAFLLALKKSCSTSFFHSFWWEADIIWIVFSCVGKVLLLSRFIFCLWFSEVYLWWGLVWFSLHLSRLGFAYFLEYILSLLLNFGFCKTFFQVLFQPCAFFLSFQDSDNTNIRSFLTVV